MRANKLIMSVVAVVVLVLSASTSAAAAPASPGDGLSIADCGATPTEWVGTFEGRLSRSGGGSNTVRAVIYQGGTLVDTFVNGKLEDSASVPWIDGTAMRWNTSTGIGPFLYSFNASGCSGGLVTSASALQQWFSPCCVAWTGTVTRTA